MKWRIFTVIRLDRKTIQHIDLFKLLVKKEVTLRYKRTYLGFLWSLLNPLLTAFVFFIAFNIFMRFEVENFVLFLLSALFPWTWFSAAVAMSSNILTGNVSLIKKVIFPKHFLLLASITAQLINFIFSLPILIGLVYYYGSAPTLNWLIGIPVLIAVQFAIIYGLSLVISVANTFFRDLEYIVNVLISLLFWMTPIIYPLDAVPEEYRVLLAMNPVTYLMQAWRDIFFYNLLNWNNIIISVITAAVVLFAGLLIFNKLDRKLDEVL
jgi:lipopolysaccharide transport system permease protein